MSSLVVVIQRLQQRARQRVRRRLSLCLRLLQCQQLLSQRERDERKVVVKRLCLRVLLNQTHALVHKSLDVRHILLARGGANGEMETSDLYSDRTSAHSLRRCQRKKQSGLYELRT